MNSIVKTIQELQQQYPKWVSMYSPADPIRIASTEKILQLNLDEQLKEIYSVTDGFGIVDYCLIGINNKRTNNILPQNYPLTHNDQFESQIVDFILTSGEEKYQFINHSNNQHHKVIRTDEIGSEVVANNIGEFLDKFLKNMKVLLDTIRDNDIVMYLDDERLKGKLIE